MRHRRPPRAGRAGRAGAALLVLGLAVAGCGTRDGAVSSPPPLVDPALAPPVVEGGERLLVIENLDAATRDAFANAGKTSLMADGRLFELRRAERLVGTLQITTLLPAIDLTDEARRAGIVRGVMARTGDRIRMRDVEVYTAELRDRAQFVWFGIDLVQILTVREEGNIDPAAVLRAVLDHQRTQRAWKPLPVRLDASKRS